MFMFFFIRIYIKTTSLKYYFLSKDPKGKMTDFFISTWQNVKNNVRLSTLKKYNVLTPWMIILSKIVNYGQRDFETVNRSV